MRTVPAGLSRSKLRDASSASISSSRGANVPSLQGNIAVTLNGDWLQAYIRRLQVGPARPDGIRQERPLLSSALEARSVNQVYVLEVQPILPSHLHLPSQPSSLLSARCFLRLTG